MVACTLLFEGSEEEVAAQERSVYRLAAAHGGMKAGAENGERGYQLTFAIAYIRDFMLEHWIIAESFETSVPWSEAQSLCANVKQRLWQEHAKRGLPGKPFISVRVTQLYPTGVCIYFYFAIYYKGVERASEVYAELERAARDEILRSGGSLSHHHGVGKLRREFLSRVFSPAALAWRSRLARSVDPDDLFGAGNG
jgi:alkyldihydroxyacetonephosphate synthase